MWDFDILATYEWNSTADSRLATSQWEKLLQSNTISDWLGAKLESALESLENSRVCINEIKPCAVPYPTPTHTPTPSLPFTKIYKFVDDPDIENLSWAPMWNGVHPSEFVFQKSQEMAIDFSGIQTHEGELHFARVPMIDSISSTMFFSCDSFTKTPEITLKSSEITIRGRNSQLSVEGKYIHY